MKIFDEYISFLKSSEHFQHILQDSVEAIEKFESTLIEGSDINHEQAERKIIDAIKRNGKQGVTKADMYNTTRSITNQFRDLILQNLIDCGKVFERDIRVNGSRKSSKHYFWGSK